MLLKFDGRAQVYGPEMGLQSRWYRQQRRPQAPDPPEPDETPVPPCSDEVKARSTLL